MMRLFNSKQEGLETPYSFQDRFKDIQRIAIIYPQKHEHLRIAKYVMQNLYNLPERFEFLIMRAAEASSLDMGIKFQLGEMNYQPTKPDRERLLSRFVAFNPDILLQLEPEPDDRLIKLLKSVPIGLKIGFGPEDSGLNIIYSQKKTGFYEKNILNLIALIRAD